MGCIVIVVTCAHAVQTEEQAHSELVGNCLLALLAAIGVRANSVLASYKGPDPPAAVMAAGCAKSQVNSCWRRSAL